MKIHYEDEIENLPEGPEGPEGDEMRWERDDKEMKNEMRTR